MSTTPTPRAEHNDAWHARNQARLDGIDRAKTAYAEHMSRAAHHLYIAGAAVKRGEFGPAKERHKMAELEIAQGLAGLPEN